MTSTHEDRAKRNYREPSSRCVVVVFDKAMKVRDVAICADGSWVLGDGAGGRTWQGVLSFLESFDCTLAAFNPYTMQAVEL